MTADESAGAAPRMLEGWHDIDWNAAHQQVRRLQARIVKATLTKPRPAQGVTQA